jgi:hypothetical protein
MRHTYLAHIFACGLLAVKASFASSEIEERMTIVTSVQNAFLQERFTELDQLSRGYRTDKSRTSSGLWRLSIFYGGLDTAMDAQTEGMERETAFRELERRTAKWAQKSPDSPAAHIAHSLALIDHAWAYRGNGYADTVKPESWAPFQRYIAMARENLEAHKLVAAVDPRWYSTMLTIARAENWNRRQFDSLLAEAFDREPLFYPTYFAALEYLLPKWHGGKNKIENFAQSAVRRTSKEEGRGMYARIYWFAAQTQFQNELFADSFANWPRMKEGFNDVVAKYPDAWNLNNYAKFAYLAKDKPQTRELLKRIGSEVVPEAWTPQTLQAECEEWARRP